MSRLSTSTFEIRFDTVDFGSQYLVVECYNPPDVIRAIKEEYIAKESVAFNFYVQEVPGL